VRVVGGRWQQVSAGGKQVDCMTVEDT